MARGGDGPEPVGQWTDDHTWTKTIWIPQIPEAHFPDDEGLSKELAVEKRAADDAVKQEPKSGATKLSATELAICERVFDGVLLLNQFLASELGKAVDAARKRDSKLSEPKYIGRRMSAAADQVLTEESPTLAALKQDQVRYDLALRRFKWENKLFRPAHYPDSAAMVLTVFFVLFVAESLINGMLFSQVMPGGLLEGWTLAGLISGANILIGVVAGLWGWRNTGHVKAGRKAMGWALLGVLHFAAVLGNLGVAHLREAAELLAAAGGSFDPGELTQATIAHVQNSGWFGLASVEGIGLLTIGIAIHLYSAKKGWDDIADRYPDYRRVDLKARNSAEDHTEAALEVRQRARAGVERIEAEVRAERDRAYANLRGIEGIIDLAKERRQEVLDSEDSWVLTGEKLLTIYRDTNTHLRGDSPPPAYFRQYPNAEAYRKRAFGSGAAPSPAVEEQEKLFERHMAALDTLRDSAKGRIQVADDVIAQVQDLALVALQKLDKTLGLTLRDQEAEAVRRAHEELASVPEGLRPGGPLVPDGGAARA